MSLQGADTTHRLDIGAIKRAGVVAVGGYANTGWKTMSKADIDAYLAAGIGVWLCWETTTTRALQGRAAGVSDATAHNNAMDARGCPLTMAACWTLDTDVPNDGQAASEYAYGWHQASKRPSAVYAETSVIDAGVAAGVIVTGWQPSARSWSNYTVSRHASIIQGIKPVIPDTDPNEIVDPHSPLIWWPFTPAVTQFINAAPQPQEHHLMSAEVDQINTYTNLIVGQAVGMLQTNLKDALGWTPGGKSVAQVVQDAANGEIAFLVQVMKDTEGRMDAALTATITARLAELQPLAGK